MMNNINLTTEELATITAALQRSAGYKEDGNRVAAIQCKNRIMDALDAAYARTAYRERHGCTTWPEHGKG